MLYELEEREQKNGRTMTVREASERMRVSRFALYIAIKKRGLLAKKIGKEWVLKEEDIDQYMINKYNPDKRKVDGKPIFDIDEGYYSIQQASKIISEYLDKPFHFQRLYYLIRKGDIQAYRKGYSWVVHKDDLFKFINTERGIYRSLEIKRIG